MDGSITVRDVANRSYVAVSEGDPIPGTARLMNQEGVTGAVILRGQEPVGLIDAIDIVAIVGDELDPATVTVDEVMTAPPPTIDAGMALSEAVHALANLDSNLAIVEAGGDLIGVLSTDDLVTAKSMLHGREEGEIGQEPPARPADDVPGGDDSLQSICEVCGSLSQPLVEVNGRLVCGDCREV